MYYLLQLISLSLLLNPLFYIELVYSLQFNYIRRK